MKKNLLTTLFAGALLVCMMASCGSSSNEYLAVSEDGKSWGMIKANGDVVFSDEFDSSISVPNHGIFNVSVDGSYTIYNIDKKPKAVKGCEDLKYAGYCIDTDILPICRANERITVINTNGETKFTINPVNGKEITMTDLAFSDGLLIVMDEDGKQGAIDESGKLAVKLRYEAVGRFSEGHAWAIKDDKYYIINKKGEEKVKIKGDYKPKGYINHGMLVVGDEDRCGFLDVKTGDIKKCPSSVRSVDDFNKRLYVFYDGDEYGIMSMDGEKLVSAKYKSISILDDGDYFLVNKDDDYMIIDKEGEKKVNLSDYDKVVAVGENNQILVAKEGKYWSLINSEGKKIDKNEYKDISIYPTVCYSMKSCYVDIDGIAAQAVEQIDKSGICNVKLGSSPSEYLSNNPSSYSYTSMFSPDVTLPEGYNYNMKLDAYTDSSIALYDYYTGYYFEPNCKVRSLILTITLPNEEETREAVIEKIESLLSSKGYKNNGKDGDTVLMKYGTTNISLDSEYGVVKIRMTKES